MRCFLAILMPVALLCQDASAQSVFFSGARPRQIYHRPDSTVEIVTGPPAGTSAAAVPDWVAKIDADREAYVEKLHAIEAAHKECAWLTIAPGHAPRYLGCQRLSAEATPADKWAFWWNRFLFGTPTVSGVPVIARRAAD